MTDLPNPLTIARYILENQDGVEFWRHLLNKWLFENYQIKDRTFLAKRGLVRIQCYRVSSSKPDLDCVALKFRLVVTDLNCRLEIHRHSVDVTMLVNPDFVAAGDVTSIFNLALNCLHKNFNIQYYPEKEMEAGLCGYV